MDIKKIAVTARKPEHDASDIFFGRWSPRAMTGEEISTGDLWALFEAAKWAPSSYNEQPWRILFAKKNTPHWDTFFNLLVDFNKGWCKNASALIVFVSKKTSSRNGKPIRTHSFDTGAAWQSLALQGSLKNLVVHGMEGFDYDKAKKDLGIPDDCQVEAMAAVGIPASPETLPKEMKDKEVPSSRRPLKETVAEGRWGFE